MSWFKVATWQSLRTARPTTTARQAEIVATWQSLGTMTATAKALGICVTRVRYVLRRFGYDTKRRKVPTG